MLPLWFYEQKEVFIQTARRILAEDQSEFLFEAAFPAYCNKNPLIRYLFWQRVEKILVFLLKQQKLKSVFDFGCGGGVLLPFLSRISERVTAFDKDLRPLEKIRSRVAFPNNVSIWDGQDFSLAEVKPSSFDIVLALDVLEHVEDLQTTLVDLVKLLGEEGEILISGPTENFAYQLGRKLAGPDYSGHYHVRNIYEIKEVLETMAEVTTLSTLYYPAPLFKIYRGRPKGRMALN